MELLPASPAYPRCPSRRPLSSVAAPGGAISTSGSGRRRRLSLAISLEEEGAEGGGPIRRESSGELSQVLRAEAAAAGMARKAATGTSTRRLWPKAVLAALDDAIAGYRWESALQEPS